MVRPISVYTEFLQTEIFQPKELATGHCHNRFMCDAKSGISQGPEIYGWEMYYLIIIIGSHLLYDRVWPSL